jgi:glycosyltransferase involved in cell wall biosynthesis
MHQNPIVTVVCSCFNHCNYVTESLQSVLNQTYKNIQLIVVDDCSSDNSVPVIADFIKENPEIIFIKNESNLGLTKSVNNAVKQATGSYFIDLAADDVLLPNCIELQVAAFEKSDYPDLAIVYGNAEEISENGNHLSYYFNVDENLKTNPKRPSGAIYKNVISTETTICSVSALYKMTVFKSLNGYDETLYYEDLDYWIRASHNYSIEFIDAVLIKKRILKNSMHTGFIKNHAVIGKSTYQIMKKAALLNRSIDEDTILRTHILLGIKRSVKEITPVLLLKNSWLWLRLKIRSF